MPRDFSYNELTHINATVWPSNLRTLYVPKTSCGKPVTYPAPSSGCSDLRGNPIEVFDIRESDKDKLNNVKKFYVPEFTLTGCDDGGEIWNLTSANIQVCVYSGESCGLLVLFQLAFSRT